MFWWSQSMKYPGVFVSRKIGTMEGLWEGDPDAIFYQEFCTLCQCEVISLSQWTRQIRFIYLLQNCLSLQYSTVQYTVVSKNKHINTLIRVRCLTLTGLYYFKFRSSFCHLAINERDWSMALCMYEVSQVDCWFEKWNKHIKKIIKIQFNTSQIEAKWILRLLCLKIYANDL